MALDVNEQAWGDVAEWITNTTTGSYFTYPWQRRNWSNIYEQGHQTVNQDIDLSIAPWRINKRSVLVDLVGNYWYNSCHDGEGAVIDASEKNKAHHTILEVIERKNVPFILSYIGGSGTSFPPTWTKYWAYKFEVDTKDNNNVGGNRFPVANFRYDKIRICPVTWWIDSDPEDMTTNIPTRSQVGGLPNAETLAAHPYCVGIGFEIFIDKNGTWTEVPMTIDIHTHFLGDGSTEDWYATESGMFTMRMPYMYNPAGTHYNNMFFGQAITNSFNTAAFSRGDERAKINSFSRSSYDSSASPGIGSIIAGDFEGFRYNQKMAKPDIATFSGFQYNLISSIDEIRDLVMRELAYIGLPFCMTRNNISTASIDNSTLYLPVFDANRCTTGEWRTGAEARELPNASWTWIYSIDPLPEDKDDDEPDEEDIGDLTNAYPNRYTNAGGLAQWVVSQTQLVRLAAYLNGTYTPTIEDLDADFKGTNPIDYIVSVQKYPFTLPNVGAQGNIFIGNKDTSILGKKLFPDWGGVGVLPINAASSYDFGEIQIPRYYDDFRDYQSRIFLFMPFVGTEELDPNLYIGHTVGLIYRVDYNTGSVIAEIKRDGLTMETKNGTISITVPFMAADMGRYQNQLAQLAYSKDMTMIKGIGTALSAGFTMGAGAQGTLSSGQPPLAALSNLAQSGVQLAANATQLSQIDYQIEHTAPHLGTISTAAAATAFFMDDRARIVIIRPKMIDGFSSAQYSHVVGNACAKTGLLSEFQGFTVCASADLSGVRTKNGARAASEAEKELIRKALQSGIYL